MKKLLTLLLTATAPFLTVNAQQGMGVGNNNPLEMLDVTGAIKVGTDINNGAGTPAGGSGTIRFRSGQFEGWNGSAWVAFGGGTLSGSGTTNYIPKWTGSTALGNSLLYDNGTNVGIGNTSPGAKLEVAGQVKITGGTPGLNKVLRSDAAGLATWEPVPAGTALQDADADTKVQVEESADEDKIRFDTFGAERMIIDNTGNVGIGTTSPDRLLNLESPTGAQMLFTRNDNNTNDGEMMGEILFDNNDDTAPSSVDAAVVIRGIASQDQGNSNKGGHLSFLTKNKSAGNVNATERMRLTADGRLGIGTSSPIAPLHVETSNSASYGNFTFYSNTGVGGPCCGGSVNQVSIHANGRVMASEFDAYSDARIKNVIGVSNGGSDLQNLLKLEITDYNMKDKSKDVKPYKKVIAQQVEQVYPQAVSTITDVVPDIYSVASIKHGYVALPANVTVGEKVKLIFESGVELATVVSVDQAGFKVDIDRSGDVFVYGREVSDFRTVDYEAISMLNVSATQELYRMILDLNKQNGELKSEVNGLKAMAEEIEKLKQWTNFEQQTNK